MGKVDHANLKATPEVEDFSGKYEDSNFISKNIHKSVLYWGRFFYE